LQAIDALQSKYGWTVDYEDPQYLSAPGIILPRPSPPNRRHANSNGTSENGFSVQIKIAPASNLPPDAASVLSTVVTAYNQSNGDGEFKLLKEGAERFSVVGIGARDSEGQIQNQQPILDLPISLAKEERNEGETIAMICRALSAQSKIRVSTDTAANAWETAKLTIGGTNMPARNMLVQALVSSGGQTYSRLIYDESSKRYELRIERLPQK
jgi:hypothetical protein